MLADARKVPRGTTLTGVRLLGVRAQVGAAELHDAVATLRRGGRARRRRRPRERVDERRERERRHRTGGQETHEGAAVEGRGQGPRW